MPEYDNTNTVTVWRKREDAHENAPDFKVNLNIDGRDLEVALWANDGSNPNAPALKGKISAPLNSDAPAEKPAGNGKKFF